MFYCILHVNTMYVSTIILVCDFVSNNFSLKYNLILFRLKAHSHIMDFIDLFIYLYLSAILNPVIIQYRKGKILQTIWEKKWQISTEVWDWINKEINYFQIKTLFNRYVVGSELLQIQFWIFWNILRLLQKEMLAYSSHFK